jgi:hypothetical protein
MTSERDFSGDVMDVLGQLFDAGATALDDADREMAMSILTSAETVATNKLPDGEFRDHLLHGCERALAQLDGGGRRSSDGRPDGDADAGRRPSGGRPEADGDLELAAEHCRTMAREVDARR